MNGNYNSSPKGGEQNRVSVMAYTNLLYHIVFRPKNSAQVIVVDKEEMLYRYIWGFVENKKGVLYRIGGMPDHIHLLVQLPATIAVADFVRDLKTSTSVFLKDNKDSFPKFEGWAKSYCALSYSSREKDVVVNYIKSQKEHHKRVSFREEFLVLLRESGVEVDMKYFMVD